MLPDAANLIPDDQKAWCVHLFASEMVRSMMCVLLGIAIPSVRIVTTGGAIWFATQAFDELFNGNLFSEHQWEYPLFAAFCCLLWGLSKKDE